jgi:hypothetical protein
MRTSMCLILTALAVSIILLGSCASLPTNSMSTSTNNSSTLASTSVVSNPVIAITYTQTFILQPDSGNYLFIDIVIENKGYDSFNTSPEYFRCIVNNASYSYKVDKSNLPSVNLPDGGKTSGKLAFHVPLGAGSNKVNVNMSYSGVRLYNVQWFKKF